MMGPVAPHATDEFDRHAASNTAQPTYVKDI